MTAVWTSSPWRLPSSTNRVSANSLRQGTQRAGAATPGGDDIGSLSLPTPKIRVQFFGARIRAGSCTARSFDREILQPSVAARTNALGLRQGRGDRVTRAADGGARRVVVRGAQH